MKQGSWTFTSSFSSRVRKNLDGLWRKVWVCVVIYCHMLWWPNCAQQSRPSQFRGWCPPKKNSENGVMQYFRFRVMGHITCLRKGPISTYIHIPLRSLSFMIYSCGPHVVYLVTDESNMSWDSHCCKYCRQGKVHRFESKMFSRPNLCSKQTYGPFWNIIFRFYHGCSRYVHILHGSKVEIKNLEEKKLQIKWPSHGSPPNSNLCNVLGKDSTTV